jgi:hypothetical protein
MPGSLSENACLSHNRDCDWVFHIGGDELRSSFRQCEGREMLVPASAASEGSDAAGPFQALRSTFRPQPRRPKSYNCRA